MGRKKGELLGKVTCFGPSERGKYGTLADSALLLPSLYQTSKGLRKSSLLGGGGACL